MIARLQAANMIFGAVKPKVLPNNRKFDPNVDCSFISYE